MSTVRLNITLPKEVVDQLDKIAGPRTKSAFIAESIRFRIEQMEKERLEAQLKEGYQNSRSEGVALTREFEAADLEGWDEEY